MLFPEAIVTVLVAPMLTELVATRLISPVRAFIDNNAPEPEDCLPIVTDSASAVKTELFPLTTYFSFPPKFNPFVPMYTPGETLSILSVPE